MPKNYMLEPKILPFPKIGNLGRAIMQASKENKNEMWIKFQLDRLFKKIRSTKNKRVQKQNSRNYLRFNDRYKSGKSVKGSTFGG